MTGMVDGILGGSIYMDCSVQGSFWVYSHVMTRFLGRGSGADAGMIFGGGGLGIWSVR